MTTTFKWTPDTILKEDPDPRRVNANFQRMATAHQTLDGTAIKSPTLGGGFVIDTGSITVTGSKLGIQTNLSAITQVVASIDNGSTATNFSVTSRVTPSNATQIDIFVWQPTSSGNNTPIASTSPVVVRYVVTGTSTASQ
jgi:hypothetical protein